MREEFAVENLRQVKEILDKVGVTFWLDDGTLLGVVRDGKIIDWDVDIDLGTWYENVGQIISAFALFKEKGFRLSVNRRYGSVDLTKSSEFRNIGVGIFRRKGEYAWKLYPARKMKIAKSFHWCIDALSLERYGKLEGKKFVRKKELFFSRLPLKLKRCMEKVVWFVMKKCDCLIPWVIPKHYFEELSTIQFYGMEFNIPSNVEKYLEYRYGSDWKTPNEDWVWFRDDGAINLNFKRKILR